MGQPARPDQRSRAHLSLDGDGPVRRQEVLQSLATLAQVATALPERGQRTGQAQTKGHIAALPDDRQLVARRQLLQCMLTQRLKGAVGWADWPVRSDRAMRRH